MSRLKYSPAGFVRSLQVSRTDLFAFVEGWSDRYFYDKICEGACRETGAAFDIRIADELPGQTGGKAALLSFFNTLRRRKLLLQDFKGKKFGFLFFLDKDIDDLAGGRKRSPHVIYTEFYHLENYLFGLTDISEVAAAAGSLDVVSLKAIIGGQTEWRTRAATEWKEWVKLCIVARLAGTNCGCSYRRSSQINAGPYGGIDAPRRVQMSTELEAACRMPSAQFQRLSQKVSRRVERIYRLGKHDEVFKGKWYAAFLSEDVHRAAAGRPYDKNGLEGRLRSIASAKLDFEGAWADYFRSRISSVISLIRA